MSDELMTVASFQQVLLAEAAKNVLEAEGIQAFIEGEHAAETFSGMLGEAHVKVAIKDVRRAHEVLDEHLAKIREHAHHVEEEDFDSEDTDDGIEAPAES